MDSTDSYKYLGILTDRKLNYSTHTSAVISRVKKSICCISRVFRTSVSSHVLAHLFKVMMLTVLLYSGEVVYPINDRDRLALERCQRFACRVFLRTFDYNVPYCTLLSKLHLQSISRTIFARRLSLIHSYVCGARIPPPGLITLISDSNTRSSSRSNHTNALLVPRFKCARYTDSAIIASSIAYNSLPQSVIDLPLSQFKLAVTTDSVFSVVMSKLVIVSPDFVLTQSKIDIL